MEKIDIDDVIVVEGKSDTYKINLAVNADTIETNGSAVSEATLKKIKLIAKKRNIIIFTDPDFNGNRIRRIVSEAVPNAKHAFLARDLAKASRDNPHKSLGIEHAKASDIVAALQNVMTISEITKEKRYSLDDLYDYGFLGKDNSKLLRQFVGEYLGIGYANAKGFVKRLNMFGIEEKEIKEALIEYGKTH